MTTYGTIVDGVARQTRFVQSADPVDLSVKINAVMAEIFADSTPQALASLTLAGAGDGHTFIAAITNAPAASVNGGIITPGAEGFCYLAGDAEGLAAARAALVADPVGTPATADEQLAGASKGTRFMGMIVVGTIRTPT